ncbi:hypothetical protein FNU76_08585 [Chitinimonas arctica]|uniref:Uncharacterized protein n=1 Tax=Chitinimonas arctica TaxID=2594795 RepID=A0A516SE24_9NEIS|nr:hypothetical protein [Chitinimonas arctica]QDQ26416.1 hypothetical protein FNU76_08585 [Chitinimonas arctica]
MKIDPSLSHSTSFFQATENGGQTIRGHEFERGEEGNVNERSFADYLSSMLSYIRNIFCKGMNLDEVIEEIKDTGAEWERMAVDDIWGAGSIAASAGLYAAALEDFSVAAKELEKAQAELRDVFNSVPLNSPTAPALEGLEELSSSILAAEG